MVTGDEMVIAHLFPLGYDVETDFRAIATARIEFTAIRRIDWTWDVAL